VQVDEDADENGQGDFAEANGLTDPVFEYDQGDGQSVVGGFVYRGSLYPSLTGKYVFSDFYRSRIFIGDPNTGSIELAALDPNGEAYPSRIYSIGEDASGELYLLGGNNAGTISAVLRIGEKIGPCTGLGGDSDLDGVCDDGGGSGVAGDEACSCEAPGVPAGCAAGCDDNCPYRANPDQVDRGGVSSSQYTPGDGSADGTGDVCQCGDMTGDGRVSLADVVRYRRKFGGAETEFNTDLCGVEGSDGVCSLADLVRVRRTFGGQATNIIEDACAAYLGMPDPLAP
jgi:hypothetical protein